MFQQLQAFTVVQYRGIRGLGWNHDGRTHKEASVGSSVLALSLYLYQCLGFNRAELPPWRRYRHTNYRRQSQWLASSKADRRFPLLSHPDWMVTSLCFLLCPQTREEDEHIVPTYYKSVHKKCSSKSFVRTTNANWNQNSLLLLSQLRMPLLFLEAQAHPHVCYAPSALLNWPSF